MRDYYLESLQKVAKEIADNDPAYYEERQRRIDEAWNPPGSIEELR